MSLGKRPSVFDVARLAGVSIASVSKALNGHPGVGRDVRARVVATAASLGYVAHSSARSLRMGRSQMIGCMVNTVTNPLYAMLIDAMERQLSTVGYTLLLANSHDSQAQEREIMSMFEKRGMDGAIVTTSFACPPGLTSLFSECRLPLVMIDRDITIPGDHVRSAHRAGVRSAVGYLLGLGHRRVALFTPSNGLQPAIERVAGYQEAFHEMHVPLDPALICGRGGPTDSGYADMQQMLERPQPPTALVGLGTRQLSGALRALREHRLRIPQDFSVIAIGEPDLMEFSEPRLTTLRFDMERMGQAAAQLVVERIDSKSSPSRSVEVPMDLVLRDSCAAAPMGTLDPRESAHAS